jgi:hypothetical protein
VLTLIPYGASSMARCWVRECRPAFATEYAEDGVAAMAWCASMPPTLTMAPLLPWAIMLPATVWVTK